VTLSRRHLIQRGLAGGFLLAAGGVGLSLQRSVLREPKGPLRALNALEFSVLSFASDRITPGTETVPSASGLGVPELIDALLAKMHPVELADFKKVLNTLENAAVGLLLDARPVPFTTGSPETQDRALASWRDSALTLRRTGYKALHKVCTSAYWGMPETFSLSGYPGPPNFNRGTR
jgi:hypothetical protein